MDQFIIDLITYGTSVVLLTAVVWYYIRRNSKAEKKVTSKIDEAKSSGLFEPVSLHPQIDYDICIGSAACVAACPEKDILGIVKGQAVTINASQCVGHGACFHACPVQAISLVIGTEKRGVELPHVDSRFETNINGLYIAGELGGMGLIKNAVEQGRQAAENISKRINKRNTSDFDLIVVGAGPAGISASLTARKHNLRFLTIEQNSLGGTVQNFPRSKIIMTSPMELPLYGNVKLRETSKIELLKIWEDALSKQEIGINENEKVESINKRGEEFSVKTDKGEYTSSYVLLAIGRRGSPRKLNIPGENKGKVAYKLLEPENVVDSRILIVGGGDSAVEAALQLSDSLSNKITISYRQDSFSRLKTKNLEKITEAENEKKVGIYYNSTVKEIKDYSVVLLDKELNEIEIDNDLVYIFAGGELPNDFLNKIGIKITKKFGEAILKH